MAFTNSTKSWGACNKDQRREAMALAVFTKLSSLPGSAKAFVSSEKRRLQMKIDNLRALDFESLTNDEKGLLVMESLLKSLEGSSSGIRAFERLYPSIKKFASLPKVDPLSGADSASLINSGELAKLIDAIGGFKWTGSSNKIPNGKTESSVGISDSLLEKLMGSTGASALLNSWMQTADAAWKRVVDAEIKKRKADIKRLQAQNPKNAMMIASVESEIVRLEKNWHL